MVSDERFADGLVEALVRLGAPAEVLAFIGTSSPSEKSSPRRSGSAHGSGKRHAVPVSK
jgi:hypothetical protein